MEAKTYVQTDSQTTLGWISMQIWIDTTTGLHGHHPDEVNYSYYVNIFSLSYQQDVACACLLCDIEMRFRDSIKGWRPAGDVLSRGCENEFNCKCEPSWHDFWLDKCVLDSFP